MLLDKKRTSAFAFAFNSASASALCACCLLGGCETGSQLVSLTTAFRVSLSLLAHSLTPFNQPRVSVADSERA